MTDKPTLLFTMGDVAGVGPEIIARGWAALLEICRPIVVGDPERLRWALNLIQNPAEVQILRTSADAAPSSSQVPCFKGSNQDLSTVRPGEIRGEAGRAAYDFFCQAIDLTLTGEADGIVTAPLHKEGLRAAGLDYPGHTEILAERTKCRQFAMMLYHEGLGVLHVTLHMALREVFAHLTTERILEKIRLLDGMMVRLLGRRAKLGIAALNPHASDGGLFGDEEEKIIRPAVRLAEQEGISATGPWPTDTLFLRATQGEFDGIVAMYHDQGHIALKLLSGLRAVNISAGLPIIRTSVAHGTAYDIAGRGLADPASLIQAAKVAVALAKASLASQERLLT